MKLLLQIIGLVVVLLGSIAIPVYQHTCSHDDVVVSSAFVKTNYCEEEEKENHGHEKSCCEENTSDNNCCEDEVTSFQIPFFQWQTEHFSFMEIALPIEPISFAINTETTLPINEEAVLYFADLPPPKLPERLALLQVWRI